MTKRFDLPHTPGPWHVGVGLMVCAEDGSPVARCSSTRGKFEYEEPNAYLIAAAPELLAFLKRLAVSGEWSRPALEFNTLRQDGEELEREMLALIAKAEGGAA